jgi:RHH-type proline utilization regulon transcriptional repressor/proline dehydrogenase/delta 1-pyrroline-5-carboxylate dehydrogenase
MSKSLSSYIYADEASVVGELLDSFSWDQNQSERVNKHAVELVSKVRTAKRKVGELESFFQQYGLNSEEGLALMTLAEALLRIPDAQTANELIKDKMVAADWLSKQGETKDLLVKAAGFGLSLTRKTLDSAVSRLGEPVIRKAMIEAMRVLGRQFVLGRTIEEAIKNGSNYKKKGYRLSYDMLGEAARTSEDADRYFELYSKAIEAVGSYRGGKTFPDSVSVKLSALYPRYEFSQKDKCIPFMTDRLSELAKSAANSNISLTVDAEEVDRLELSLDIFKNVLEQKNLRDWDGFGLAVQAYQKRALGVVDLIEEWGKEFGQRLNVRLVKGAYWDTEIKRSQVMGLSDYPVFTRKANTDLSFMACSHKLLGLRDYVYPMFATHNAHSIAAILDMAGNDREGFEFQRLHGMGETLHDVVLNEGYAKVCVYAPCGTHEDLLPYLVRRLLENGANSSFVNQILDERVSIDDIVFDPVNDTKAHTTKKHPRIPLPEDIYGAKRKNSKGIDLTEGRTVAALLEKIGEIDKSDYHAEIKGFQNEKKSMVEIINPAIKTEIIGTAAFTDPSKVNDLFIRAKKGFLAWRDVPASKRGEIISDLANLLEERTEELMGLCIKEAGKTLEDALAEIREAVDFCRYYAHLGAKDFDEKGIELDGPTGESNVLILQGRGTFVCISPWNFPLAIFTGQVVAALMAGNSVIAKPAEQTPLIANLLREFALISGVPEDAFILAPGDGELGAKLVGHPDVSGVAFTGSTEVARQINRSLAMKDGSIVPLIAETGGQNAMIVDSSALLEQVVDDVCISAFGSAGQRCSALRVLFLQEDVADSAIKMLKGAMEHLVVGDPVNISSDIGPVIDDEALQILKDHVKKLDKIGQFIAQAPLSKEIENQGYFFSPVIYEIEDISLLEREVFGPILHLVRYKADDLDKVISKINQTGYGLTLGVHSRISSKMNKIANSVDVGNAYINRTMIGAVVGVQPFGGQGLSGTGPKAGGPHYLHRFATEKVISIDTTRQGGNASLVSLEE